MIPKLKSTGFYNFGFIVAMDHKFCMMSGVFGCLKPFFSAPVITADFEILPRVEGSLVGVVSKRQHGKWASRLAELNVNEELQLFKTATDKKTYDLKEMRKLLLSSGQNSLHVKMILKDGEKLYLKIKGPDRNEWGSRITHCKFPEKKSTPPKRKAEEKEEILNSDPSRLGAHWRPRRSLWMTEEDSEETSSESLAGGMSPTSCYTTPSDFSRQSTQLARDEDEKGLNDSIVARMARGFEPEYCPKNAGATPRHR